MLKNEKVRERLAARRLKEASEALRVGAGVGGSELLPRGAPGAGSISEGVEFVFGGGKYDDYATGEDDDDEDEEEEKKKATTALLRRSRPKCEF